MTDCLFCKIIAGDIPSSKVFEDGLIFVFKDINPKAAVHLLAIPKIHIDSLDKLSTQHQALISHMMLKLPELARSQGLNDGFRTIINTGPGGGQEVGHLHMHILGGKDMPGFN
ncbi:MAG: histidine triad nucleotide-binding protein [Gammaproteobacteria bacterium]|nr:MAG: histidine triad nucleotide-binding protein [Gammaproteobacteria bacterium]RKZ94546.1 MAG: histidine triad nucleotide-binding protein [Gammaproteobacteria bacterium]RLA00864.1 MAG: histidine triad nucleotide-binding protein [Gammaproteobacteria bacterium]